VLPLRLHERGDASICGNTVAAKVVSAPAAQCSLQWQPQFENPLQAGTTDQDVTVTSSTDSIRQSTSELSVEL
jgi:hypothetical protein